MIHTATVLLLAQVLALLIISGGSFSVLSWDKDHPDHDRDHPAREHSWGKDHPDHDRDHPAREHSWDKDHPDHDRDAQFPASHEGAGRDERNDNDFAETPEPSSLVLLATAVTGVALVSRRLLRRPKVQ